MPQSTDAIGLWNDLGTITPIYDQWVVFPTVSDSGNALLRASFFCSDFDKINSYLYFRSRYQVSPDDQVSLATRIYPSTHSSTRLLFELPIPKSLLDLSVYLRSIEVKKIIAYERYTGISPDINYDVRLEELY